MVVSRGARLYLCASMAHDTPAPAPSSIRKIIHIDMDAFYASVEQRDHPAWRSRPLVVGRPEARSVIAAASYEARQWGVRSGMPALTAMKLCPQLIFAPFRLEAYKAVSSEVMKVFRSYTPLVEPLSLDEAYLDVTTNLQHIASATEIARAIKAEIRERLDLTASAGVSYNKFLAKVASDYNKPDGLFVITPKEGEAFAEQLDVGYFFGVGKATKERMQALGIRYGRDLKALGEVELVRLFGKRGRELYLNACGIDHRPVVPEYDRLSVGTETTLPRDISDLNEIIQILDMLSHELERRLERASFVGHCLTLRIKYADFTLRSKSTTQPYPLLHHQEIYPLALELIQRFALERPIRLVGLSVKRSHRHSTLEASMAPGYYQPRFPFWDEL